MIRTLDDHGRRSRRPTTTFTERVRWVQRLRQSGMSQQAFARQHGLSLSTLSVWIKQAQETQRPREPMLCEVSVPGLLSPWAAEVARPGGVTVRLSAQIARELLANILADPGAC